MSSGPKNKVAFITGAGQGVGQGIALALAKEGVHIAVAGRTLEKCETSAALIRDLGVKAIALECDVTCLRDLTKSVDASMAEFGRLDILVNNAQQVALGTFEDVNEADFQAGWDSGPLASFRLMKMCYPHLKGGGHIINILSSVMKRWDMSGYGAYAAVKAAMHELTRWAACEWGKDGIRVNAIMPHAKSPSLAWWAENNPREAAAFAASIPLKRIGECEQDIGAFVALMCKDEAGYLTGQTIGLDGGQALIG